MILSQAHVGSTVKPIPHRETPVLSLSNSRFVLVLTLASGIVCGSVSGQEPPTGSIVAVGQQTIRKSPEQIVVAVELIARSRDLAQAGQILQERIAAAKSQMIALGASAGEIHVDRVQVSSDESDAMNELSANVQEGYLDAGEEEAAAAIQPLTTLTVTFVAAFDIGSDDSIAQLQQFDQLARSISAADLSGVNDMTGLSPEDEELVAEAMLLSIDEYSDEPPLGTPSFFYSARLDEAEIARATKQAYQAARKKASLLATAADVSIGGLLSLKEATDEGTDEYGYGYSAARGSISAARSMMGEAAPDSTVIIALDTGQLKTTVGVSATFRLVP